jgi:CubicO group peptidase (beta-lactamase class C family)
MIFHRIVLIHLIILLGVSPGFSQANFEWPQTPAGAVFEDFVTAYNSGEASKIEAFVQRNYARVDTGYVTEKTEYWMDIYHRFGPVSAHSFSINKPLDLEVWVQGTTTRIWFAPEFVLAKDSNKVRAVGMLLGSQPPEALRPAQSDVEFISRVEHYLESNVHDNFFQGTVLVKKNGKVVINRGFGFKNVENQEKNKADTRMRTASVSKVVTAIAALQLVQQGQLNIHQPVSSYLPDLPKHIADKITIYQILTHTSGYELDGIDGFRDALEKTHSMSEVYALQLKYLPKWEGYDDFEEAERFDYSNDSYDLLAIIIEKVSGLSYPDFLKTRIFDVIGMPDTSFSNENISTPYRYDIGQNAVIDQERHYPYSWGQVSGAAALNTTVADLNQLFDSLKNTQDLIDLPHKSLLVAPLVSRGGQDYQSLGLVVSYEQALNLGHSGESLGHAAQMRYFPDSDYLLVVLSNNRSGAPNLYNFFKNNLPVTTR